jgi:hypothetical protein
MASVLVLVSCVCHLSFSAYRWLASIRKGRLSIILPLPVFHSKNYVIAPRWSRQILGTIRPWLTGRWVSRALEKASQLQEKTLIINYYAPPPAPVSLVFALRCSPNIIIRRESSPNHPFYKTQTLVETITTVTASEGRASTTCEIPDEDYFHRES